MSIRTFGLFLLFAICSGIGQPRAYATPEEESAEWGAFFEAPTATASRPGPSAYARTAAILKRFGALTEEDPQPLADLHASRQTVAGLRRILSLIDPGNHLSELSAISALDLKVFRDYGYRQVPDFEVRLARDEAEREAAAPDFHRRLRRAARENSASQPLLGLRIALDPGHMGGAEWDQSTGKRVRDSRGRFLSEGVLALQVCLLLERELRALGAEVFLTRRGLVPVTAVAYSELDVQWRARDAVNERTLDSWFLKLVDANPMGPALVKSFQVDPNFKQLFSESSRWKYFFMMEDLEARAKAMQAWGPDLAIMVHFDTPGPVVSQRSLNATKTYIVGSVGKNELASREARKLTAAHLTDGFAWDASLGLGRQLVGQIHRQLGSRLQTTGGGGEAVLVEPGIFARNLAISRHLHSMAVSYLEAFYYSDPAEFEALSKTKYPLEIQGRNYPYSDRLGQLVGAMRDGIVGFARSY